MKALILMLVKKPSKYRLPFTKTFSTTCTTVHEYNRYILRKIIIIYILLFVTRHLPNNGDDHDLCLGHYGCHGDQSLQPRKQSGSRPEVAQDSGSGDSIEDAWAQA